MYWFSFKDENINNKPEIWFSFSQNTRNNRTLFLPRHDYSKHKSCVSSSITCKLTKFLFQNLFFKNMKCKVTSSWSYTSHALIRLYFKKIPVREKHQFKWEQLHKLRDSMADTHFLSPKWVLIPLHISAWASSWVWYNSSS
jgi:hypothetical protein